jgi:NAD(P)-dependent dehydrogenase (short-subunit alcohol dehydrogenase family)
MKKVIVITGVSSGVGKSAVERFLKEGHIVIGLSRTPTFYQSPNFIHIETDIKNVSSIEYAFKRIQNEFIFIDVLVNNAAIFKMKPFVEFSNEEIDDIIDTNLKGTIFCTLNALKCMKSGRIINISSVSGLHGIENQTVYSSTKYALSGFAESLNQELIKRNILISTIHPGGIDTPLWNINNKYPGGSVHDLLDSNDVVDVIQYIINLPNNVVLKDITLFPKHEWH